MINNQNSYYSPSPSPSPSSPPSSFLFLLLDQKNPGAIIGATIASFFVLASVLVIAMCCFYKKKFKRRITVYSQASELMELNPSQMKKNPAMQRREHYPRDLLREMDFTLSSPRLL